MTEFLIAAGSLAAGLLAGWLFGHGRGSRAAAAERESRSRAEQDLAVARAHAEEKEKGFQEQLGIVKDARKQLEDAFGNLSKQALAQNNQAFLEQADLKMKPLQDTLKKLEAHTGEIEKARASAYGSLQTQLTELSRQAQQLQASNQSLATALRGQLQARGRWGELALRNIAELAGMTRHCDFAEQTAIAGGSRPDMVVQLPGGGRIPVDAKAPLAAYLDALEEDDPVRRKEHMRRLARDLRGHVQTLAGRDYAGAVEGRIDFTVMFLPADPYLAAAFEENPGLLDEALEKRVLISTPVTLVALLRTVGLYWQQEAMAENAEAVWEAARALYTRVTKFQEHFHGVGRGLERAVKAFNQADASFEARVVPAGRKLEDVQPDGKSRKLADSAPVEITPRPGAARELETGG